MASKVLRRLKLTIVGDSFVGKDFLCFSFMGLELPSNYFSISDCYKGNIKLDDEEFDLDIWSHCGLHDYEILRPNDYPETDCFILCYSIDCPKSFNAIEISWINEIRATCPDTPILLVATKLDTRHENSNNKNIIKKSNGQKLAKRIQAEEFFECSSLQRINVDEVFKTAVKLSIGIETKKQNNFFCMSLR